MRSPVVALVTRYVGRLRYPWLFAITGALFLADLFIPDIVPFADELLLALATMLIASRKRDEPASNEQGDTTRGGS